LVEGIRRDHPAGPIFYILLGTKFGCLASIVTAFFFTTQFLVFDFIQRRPPTLHDAIDLAVSGTAYFSVLALFLFPAIVVSGGFFAWGNGAIVKRLVK